MKIATLLFTYHRSYHTEKVLEALRDNTVQPQKLLVFQDGLKQDEDSSEWRKVNKLIQGIDWCDKEVIVSDYNKGLADSIVSGVDYAFQGYDAVIVLEDDCVASPSYMQFMVQGLIKYEGLKKVYSVSGFNWPVKLEKSCYDAYSCGRVSSLGWGTWKDRWADYKRDVNILKRLKFNQSGSRNLLMWGKDLEAMLAGTITGQYDSWGVYWALKVIENNGICINPYISLINHIGWDSTGTNADSSSALEIEISNDRVNEFVFPDDVTILDCTKKAFAEVHGSYTAVSHENPLKENIMVYGLGNFYLKSEKAVNDKYNILAFVDRRKHGWFAGKRIITMDKITQYQYDKILIMVKDIQECLHIIRELAQYEIDSERIVLGNGLFGKDSDNIGGISISLDADEVKLDIMMKGVPIKVRSKDEFWNAYATLVSQTWNYVTNNGKEDVVLDVGLNIGDTALYFLHHKKVKKVYGYEPFRRTFLEAEENLKFDLQNAEKVEIFQYGISDENSRRIIDFNKDMTCGQSTIADVRKGAYALYRNAGLVQAENEEKECIQVKDAMEVFHPIIQRHSDCNIVLKMDCEGEEYNIMKRLSETGLIEKMTIIMLEWHYRGKEDIFKYLNNAGFTYWCNDIDCNMGLIYAVKM